MRTERGVSVSRLELWIVTVTHAYDPVRLHPYPDAAKAISAAQRIMAEEDSRGLIREWEVDDGRPRGTLMTRGGSFDRTPRDQPSEAAPQDS
ncbi:hypothetical protein AB0K52_00175 [Glycomyces sp. NPDC049804]|uniref:hypothetical protein n=1 Tax=Glycomyces sp. NPDC049804 TaxID=3154363 RepID=UPI0034146092